MDTSPQNLQLLAALLSRSSSAAQPQLHALQTIPTTSQVSYANAPSPLEQLLLQSSSSPSLLQSPLALAALVASNAAPTRSRCPAALTERQRFVIFVKVLFKYMDRLNNSSLKVRAKAIIAECTERNRRGIPEYTPLMSAVERRLKQSIGEIHWSRAQICFQSYLRKTASRSLNASAIEAI